MNKNNTVKNYFHEFLHGPAAEYSDLKNLLFDYAIKAFLIFNTYEFFISFLLKKHIFSSATLSIYLLFLLFINYYKSNPKNTDKYKALYISFCLVTNCLYFPALYLFSGGIKSGVPLLFIIGGIIVILLLNHITALLVFLVGMGTFAATYYYDFYHPGLVEKFTVLGNSTYFEISSATLVVSIGAGIILRILANRFDENQNKANELLFQIEDSSNRDPLTGVYNRRYLMNYIDECISKTEAEEIKIFSVLMFDIDHFKQVNDNYGHLAGDDCIEGFAYMLKKNLRKVDVISRYGGEEFICVLPTADETQAFRRAEQIRVSIETSILSEAVDSKVTVSGGVAVYKPGMTADELIKEVDNNLYIAKESGRNQIVWHNGGIPPLCYVAYSSEVVQPGNRRRRFTDHDNDAALTGIKKSSNKSQA